MRLNGAARVVVKVSEPKLPPPDPDPDPVGPPVPGPNPDEPGPDVVPQLDPGVRDTSGRILAASFFGAIILTYIDVRSGGALCPIP